MTGDHRAAGTAPAACRHRRRRSGRRRRRSIRRHAGPRSGPRRLAVCCSRAVSSSTSAISSETAKNATGSVPASRADRPTGRPLPASGWHGASQTGKSSKAGRLPFGRPAALSPAGGSGRRGRPVACVPGFALVVERHPVDRPLPGPPERRLAADVRGALMAAVSGPSSEWGERVMPRPLSVGLQVLGVAACCCWSQLRRSSGGWVFDPLGDHPQAKVAA